MNWADRVKLALKAKGMRQSHMAAHFGTSHQNISSMMHSYQPDRIQEIADFLGVEVDYLLLGINPPAWDTTNRAESPAQQYFAGEAMKTQTLPTVVGSLTAGDGGGVAEIEPERIEIAEGTLSARVHGDSGGLTVMDGQYVILAPAHRKPKRGNPVAVVTFDGRSYLKRWFPLGSEQVVLQSIDSRYPPVVLNCEDIADIRVVIGTLWEKP